LPADMAEEQTINLSQLLLVLLIGGLAVRFFFFSGSSSRTVTASTRAENTRVREADVERIQQMFPQVPRRTIMWDLHRNGGNIAATTERILTGRGLELPPQTFQPPPPPAALSSTSAVNSTSGPAKSQQPDLIARYNLTSKIASESVDTTVAEPEIAHGGKQAWSQNKNERQALLQKRRDEMILAARRKMEAKLAAERTADQGDHQSVG